jgi:hypothetical protein
MRPLVLITCVLAVACGSKSPTTPSPNTLTRIIHLNGDLNFGSVDIGQQVTKQIAIVNNGTGPLTVTNITVPAGNASGFAASWTSGVIASGSQQVVTIRFQPTEARSYSGTLTVQGDQTAGPNTMPITAVGLGPLFERSGTGNQVFDLPSGVTRLRVTGRIVSSSTCQNFIARRNGSSFVNAIIGTCSVADGVTYDGTHLVSGPAVIEIVSSEGVAWTFTEIR